MYRGRYSEIDSSKPSQCACRADMVSRVRGRSLASVLVNAMPIERTSRSDHNKLIHIIVYYEHHQLDFY